ncbi:MAG: hypothetical protein AAGF97_19645 [Planctomycetota bacterium]
MSHSKKHPDHHGDHHHGADGGKKKKLIHHDWRFWTAIVLMLIAMAVYVISFDESLRPGDVEEEPVPMMAE